MGFETGAAAAVVELGRNRGGKEYFLSAAPTRRAGASRPLSVYETVRVPYSRAELSNVYLPALSDVEGR